MRTATIHLRGALLDFVRADPPLVVSFELPVGLRDLVQSVGIPHVEVGVAMVDRRPAGWDEVVDDGQVVGLVPRYPLDAPLDDPRFLLDVHLGKLARHLRLLGFDTAYRPDADDDALAARASAEARVLLTRDLGLLMRGTLASGSYIRATDPRLQAIEVLERFELATRIRELTRCLVCNGLLADVDVEQIDVPPSVRSRHSEFRRCLGCGRSYWPGSHLQRLRRLVTELTEAVGTTG